MTSWPTSSNRRPECGAKWRWARSQVGAAERSGGRTEWSASGAGGGSSSRKMAHGGQLPAEGRTPDLASWAKQSSHLMLLLLLLVVLLPILTRAQEKESGERGRRQDVRGE